MKKRIVLITSVLMMLCLLILPVRAADATATMTSADAKPGDTVTLTVSVTSVTAQTCGISFEYDKTAFDIITEFNESDGFKSSNNPWTLSTEPAIFNWDENTEMGAIMYMSNNTISGNIFTVKFKVLDTATPGKYEIKVAVQLKTSSGALTVDNQSGYITLACNHSYTGEIVDAKYLKEAATCSKKAVYYKSCVTCGEKGTETFETGETLPHTFDQKVTTSAFLASAADCVNKAKYYYSCKCEAKGTETFEHGETASHNYSKKIETADYLKSEADCENAKTYYYACSGCDTKGTTTYIVGDPLGHTGGTATCTTKAICERCNKEYGEKLPHTFDQKKEESKYLKNEADCKNAKTYYYSCICGEKGTETFTVGTATGHSFTAQTESYKYIAKYGTCTTKATYYYSCTGCGEKGTETFESKVTPSHDYDSAWKSDEDGHYHECSVCYAIKDSTAHTPGKDATETTPQTCTVCGYVIKAALGHTHNYGTEVKYDNTTHYYVCSCGTKKDVVNHEFDNPCDATCNGCAYTRTTQHELGDYVTDTNNHWHECNKCHEVFDKAAHTPGAEATETTPQTCTECGYVLKEAMGHTHSFTSKHDNTNHWDECSCGEKENVKAHTFDEGKVLVEPTVDKEGTKKYTCTCGYEKTEQLPKLEAPVEAENKVLTYILIGIGGLVVIGGIITGIVISKKRKHQ